MRTEIHIPITDALNIAHSVLKHLSAHALRVLLDAVMIEHKKRTEEEKGGYDY